MGKGRAGLEGPELRLGKIMADVLDGGLGRSIEDTSHYVHTAVLNNMRKKPVLLSTVISIILRTAVCQPAHESKSQKSCQQMYIAVRLHPAMSGLQHAERGMRRCTKDLLHTGSIGVGCAESSSMKMIIHAKQNKT